jgi:8-oxo-dGTP pyrophosphatase MutT (NUDIX family)
VTEVSIRDAATVMLVRDGVSGLEVFLLRRTPGAVFAGGAHVFPGGAVDDADREPGVEACCDGRTDDDASQVLGLESGGLAYWVAAVRECFEEAGVLLAHDRSGELVRFDHPDVAARFERARREVAAGSRRLVDVCGDEGLRLALGDIHYVSHWITPPGLSRRFDTRFFVARAPAAQRPLHDRFETVASAWVRPADALAAERRGEIELILPTMHSLGVLDRFAGTDELLTAIAAIDEVPLSVPRLVREQGGVRVLLQGDDGYEDATPIPAGGR